MTEPIAITGIGVVSALGNTARQTWQQLIEGASGADTIDFLNGSEWPVRIGHQVRDMDSTTPSYSGDSVPLLFAKAAAAEALKEAAIPGGFSELGPRGACYLGAGIGAISPQEILYKLRGFPLNPAFSGLQSYLEQSATNDLLQRHHPGRLTLNLARHFEIQGPLRTFTTACSASAQAIGHGFQDIRRGKIDVALVGGADSLAGQVLMLGFCLLGVMSDRNDEPLKAARPFDRDRNGFLIGEGAGMLVLESYQHARQRGAKIIATIEGYGESENAYRITDLPEDGKGAIKAMNDALRNANLTPANITCVNTHGTATVNNDRIESLAILEAIGDHAFVTANKAAFGHLIAAAGAIETAISALMVSDRLVPPILNHEQTDCAPLRYVLTPTNLPEQCRVISNSFGFGGTNCSLIIGPPGADRGGHR